MPESLQWRSFWTITYVGNSERKAAIIPIFMVSEYVRIEISILTLPKPKWYLAGWINQVYQVNSRPFIMPSTEVPFPPSLYKMPTDTRYQIKFKPVPYLPDSVIRFYRSV
jgi:hypothetical protein